MPSVASCWIFVSLVIFCVTISLGKHSSKKNDPKTCGELYEDLSGTIQYYNKSNTVPKDVECSWTISFTDNSTNTSDPKDHKIFLVFDELLLGPDDNVQIKDANGKPLNFPPNTLSNVTGAFPFLTGKSNITVILSTSKDDLTSKHDRTFQIHYYSNSACNHTFDKTGSGIFWSPFYDVQEYTMPIKCHFSVAVQDKKNNVVHMWLNKFIFQQGEISIKGSQIHDGNYSAANFPVVEFLANDELQLDLTIQNSTSATSIGPQMFIATYESAKKECSFSQKVSGSGVAAKLNSPSKDVLRYVLSTPDRSLSCHWLVDADDGHTLTITIKNISLPQALDHLLILDGPNRSSPVLLEVDHTSKDMPKLLYSSGKSLWVSASTPFVDENFAVQIEVTQTSNGGYIHGTGNVFVDKVDTTFLLDVESGKQARLVLDKATSITGDGATVSFYKDFSLTSDPFLTLTSSKLADVIESPTEKMAVVTKNFAKSTLNGTLSGIDKGCYRYGQGSGDTFSVSSHCNESCAWIIQPITSSKDLLTFHFQTMNPSESDHVIIRKLDISQTLVANISSPSSKFPDLWIPADTGAIIQVTRTNCTSNSTVIRASYQVAQVCSENLSPALGESVQVSSPGYPDHYPLGTNCTWTVKRPNNESLLLVSLKDMQLAQKTHNLSLYTLKGVTVTLLFIANSTNTELPDDMLISDDLLIAFTTDLVMPQDTLPGFKLVVTVADAGGVLQKNSDVIKTSGFPKPIAQRFLFTWLVKINSTDKQKEILNFTFTNDTDLGNVIKYLKIYDGSSTRATTVLENSTVLSYLSRTNQLLLVYQSNDSSSTPGFSLGYHNHSCNMSMICANGICMHEDWHCNGVNDCGDYSDERDCKGGVFPPPPTPSPGPSPSPSKGDNGVSTGVFVGTFCACLVVGVVLGVTAPIAYRRFRNRNLTSYTSLN